MRGAALPVLSVLAIVVAAACGGGTGLAGSGEGSFVRGSFANEHGERDYRLYVPEVREGPSAPLLVMLHGCGQDAEDLAAGTRMNELAGRDGFLVLYPDQDRGANPSRCWNWFDPSDQERGSGEPSIIAGATEEVIAEHDVDRDRVYVAGMSAGGAMSTIMGATYPDLYAAVGMHSGLEYGAADGPVEAVEAQNTGGPAPEAQGRRAFLSAPPAEKTRVLPVIVFHGEEDRVVDVVNGHQALSQWAQTNDYAVDGADNDGVDDEPDDVLRERAPGGHGYARYVYEGAGGDVLMEKWIIEDLGHRWSGGGSEGSFGDPEGPDASEEMVRFLGLSGGG